VTAVENIEHAPACTQANGTTRYKSVTGRCWVRCSCGALWEDPAGWTDRAPTTRDVLARSLRQPREPVVVVPPRLPVSDVRVSPFRCAVHVDVVVNVRGRGCVQCDNDTRARAAARKPKPIPPTDRLTLDGSQ
jgi:hypothetical protein